jgi:hypothetical protein
MVSRRLWHYSPIQPVVRPRAKVRPSELRIANGATTPRGNDFRSHRKPLGATLFPKNLLPRLFFGGYRVHSPQNSCRGSIHNFERSTNLNQRDGKDTAP